jgi:hypothetical protein
VSVPTPAGTAAGDVLVAFVSAPTAPAALTAPPGWSTVRTDANGSGLETATFVRVAGASEPPTYTFGLNRANAAVVVAAVAGADPTNPVDAHGSRAADYTRTLTAPALTATSAGDLLVMFGANQGGASWTPPSSMTQVGEAYSRDLYCCNVFTHVAAEALTTAGDTGPRSATVGVDYVQATATAVALEPLGEGGFGARQFCLE